MSDKQHGSDRTLIRAAGKAGAIMSLSLLVSRILGLLRDTVIGSQFGLTTANDSLQIALQIPDMIFMLIAGGGLSSAFIPVFSELWYTDKKREAWKVFSVVVTVCSMIAIFLIAIAWVLSPNIVAAYGAKKPEVIPGAILMSRIILPAQFAFLIGSILLATLYARKKFLGPSLAPNVYNLGIILGAMLLPAMFGFGIVGVAWGALVGAFIGNLILPAILMIPGGTRFRPSLDVKAEGVGKFFRLLLPVILGFSLPSMVQLVTQYFASPYGLGTNAVVRYSNNLMQSPLGIFGQSLALGAFPALSQFFAQKRMDLYRDLVSKTMRTVVFLCVPSAAFMFALAPLLVKVIYGYGKASSDPNQLKMIADFLRIYCISIPFWCVQPVLMRGFFSLHNTLKPVLIGTAMTVAFVIGCVLVRGNPMGVLALPWLANIAAIILVFWLIVALEKEVGKVDRSGLTSTFMKSLIASIPAALIGYFALQLYEPTRKLWSFTWFLFLGLSMCAIFYAIARALKMPEGQYLDRALAKGRIKKENLPTTPPEP